LVNQRKTSKRVARGSSVNIEVWERLKAYSEAHDMPISRLLDRAITEFLDRNK
jgi:post-segregation antitoxin (ccd killing protein)